MKSNILFWAGINNTITDGGVAPQCTFARPTLTHIEHIDTREYKAKLYIEHKDGRMVGRIKRRPKQSGAPSALRRGPYAQTILQTRL